MSLWQCYFEGPDTAPVSGEHLVQVYPFMDQTMYTFYLDPAYYIMKALNGKATGLNGGGSTIGYLYYQNASKSELRAERSSDGIVSSPEVMAAGMNAYTIGTNTIPTEYEISFGFNGAAEIQLPSPGIEPLYVCAAPSMNGTLFCLYRKGNSITDVNIAVRTPNAADQFWASGYGGGIFMKEDYKTFCALAGINDTTAVLAYMDTSDTFRLCHLIIDTDETNTTLVNITGGPVGSVTPQYKLVGCNNYAVLLYNTGTPSIMIIDSSGTTSTLDISSIISNVMFPMYAENIVANAHGIYACAASVYAGTDAGSVLFIPAAKVISTLTINDISYTKHDGLIVITSGMRMYANGDGQSICVYGNNGICRVGRLTLTNGIPSGTWETVLTDLPTNIEYLIDMGDYWAAYNGTSSYRYVGSRRGDMIGVSGGICQGDSYFQGGYGYWKLGDPEAGFYLSDAVKRVTTVEVTPTPEPVKTFVPFKEPNNTTTKVVIGSIIALVVIVYLYFMIA